MKLRVFVVGAEILLLLCCAWQLWALGHAWLARIPFPFDIEWMEGGTLVSAWRLQQGLPIHGAPALDYIPFIYPPLYPAVVAFLANFFPLDYTLARSVSASSSLLSAGALFYGSIRLGARVPLALGIATCFLGTWDDCGTFYDMIRVDALTIALLGWALVLGAHEKAVGTVVGGILLALAFMAKHNAAMWGFPMVAGIFFLYGRQRALLFTAASAGPALLFTLWYSYLTDWQFLDWLLGVPSAHGIKLERLVSGISKIPYLKEKLNLKVADGAQLEFWNALPISVTLGLLFPQWLYQGGKKAIYWSGAMVVGVVACSLMRGHTGGFINVLIPMYWLESLWPVLVLAMLAERWKDSTEWRTPKLAAGLITLLVALQVLQGGGAWSYRKTPWKLLDSDFWKSHYTRYLPTERDWKDAQKFIEELKTLPEPILITHAPFAAIQAGKQPSFSLICLWDIDYKAGPYYPYVKQIEKAMKEHYWATIVLPNDELGFGLKKHYHQTRSLKSSVPDTLVGWEVRLKAVWEPNIGESPD
jgi:hypothetical protein